MKPAKTASKPAFVLVQPEASCLIRQLRQLTELTQVQLAERLGVAYETINRWENGRIQPSPLALRQIHSVIDQLAQSPSQALREGSKALLSKYFSGEEGL